MRFSILALCSMVAAGVVPDQDTDSTTPDLGLDQASTMVAIPEANMTLSFCRVYGKEDTCDSMSVTQGRCYDLEEMDPFLHKNIQEVGVTGGNCKFWGHKKCQGKHTSMFTGQRLSPDQMCVDKVREPWSKKAASIRCCAGEPTNGWCGGNPIENIECTDQGVCGMLPRWLF